MRSARVLVVRDSGDFSDLIGRLLTSSGYTVLPVISSREVTVRKSERSIPDIALINVEIAVKLDGIESGGPITENLGIPIIFLSGCMDENILNRVKKRPSGYLITPFNQAEHKAAIEIALYKYRAQAGA